MTIKFPSTGFDTPYSVLFTHQQLRQVLSAYAEGVLQKHWKDYSISTEKDQTTFCVIERGQGAGRAWGSHNMAVIYSISRTKGRKGQDYYRVFDGEKQICRTEKFLEALNIFRQAGIPGQKKGKFKVIE